MYEVELRQGAKRFFWTASETVAQTIVIGGKISQRVAITVGAFSYVWINNIDRSRNSVTFFKTCKRACDSLE